MGVGNAVGNHIAPDCTFALPFLQRINHIASAHILIFRSTTGRISLTTLVNGNQTNETIHFAIYQLRNLTFIFREIGIECSGQPFLIDWPHTHRHLKAAFCLYPHCPMHTGNLVWLWFYEEIGVVGAVGFSIYAILSAKEVGGDIGVALECGFTSSRWHR